MVTAEGFAPGMWRGRDGKEGAPVEVRLTKSARVVGRVTRPGGEPVVGASVRAVSLGDRNFLGGAESTLAGADGRFELADVTPGDVMVIAEAKGLVTKGVADVSGQGYNPLATPIKPGETTTVDVEMVPGARATGTVTDSGGTPVRGAVVTATLTDSRQGGVRLDGSAGGPTAVTGADGGFSLDPLVPSKAYAFAAECAGFASTKPEVVTATESSPLVVVAAIRVHPDGGDLGPRRRDRHRRRRRARDRAGHVGSARGHDGRLADVGHGRRRPHQDRTARGRRPPHRRVGRRLRARPGRVAAHADRGRGFVGAAPQAGPSDRRQDPPSGREPRRRCAGAGRVGRPAKSGMGPAGDDRRRRHLPAPRRRSRLREARRESLAGRRGVHRSRDRDRRCRRRRDHVDRERQGCVGPEGVQRARRARARRGGQARGAGVRAAHEHGGRQLRDERDRRERDVLAGEQGGHARGLGGHDVRGRLASPCAVQARDRRGRDRGRDPSRARALDRGNDSRARRARAQGRAGERGARGARPERGVLRSRQLGGVRHGAQRRVGGIPPRRSRRRRLRALAARPGGVRALRRAPRTRRRRRASTSRWRRASRRS